MSETGLDAKAFWSRVFWTVTAAMFFAGLAHHSLTDEMIKRGFARTLLPLLDPTSRYDHGISNVSDSTDSKDSRDPPRITLVTLDDADLSSYGATWPFDIDFHARRVREIIKEKPLAIFIDIMFLDDRDRKGAEDFRDALCEASSVGVAVAVMSGRDIGFPSKTQDIIFGGPNIGVDPSKCVMEVGGNVVVDKFDSLAWTYDLKLGKLPSAAVALYERLPSHLKKHSHVQFSGRASDMPRRMELMWGVSADPRNVQWMNRADESGKSRSNCRDRWSRWELLPSSLAHGWIEELKKSGEWDHVADRAKPICPSHLVIPARAFKGIGFTPPQIGEGIGKSIVMYGQAFQGAGDIQQTPFHGPLPGIHLHAMALDNLIAFGGKFKRQSEFSPEELIHGDLDSVWIFLGILFLVISATFVKTRTFRGNGAVKSYLDVMAEVRMHCLQSLARLTRHQVLWRGFVGVVGGLALVFWATLAGMHELAWKFAGTLAILIFLFWRAFGRVGLVLIRLSVLFCARVFDAIVPLLLAAVVIAVLYYGASIGPFAWIEYAFYPVLAEFFELGERLQEFSAQAQDWIEDRSKA